MKFPILRKNTLLIIFLAAIIFLSVDAKVKNSKEQTTKAVDPPVTRRVRK